MSPFTSRRQWWHPIPHSYTASRVWNSRMCTGIETHSNSQLHGSQSAFCSVRLGGFEREGVASATPSTAAKMSSRGRARRACETKPESRDLVFNNDENVLGRIDIRRLSPGRNPAAFAKLE